MIEPKDNPLKQIKKDLQSFWENFIPCGPNEGQCVGKCRSKEFKIQLLQEYAEKRYWFKYREPLPKRRDKFRKARRHKKKLKNPCFICQEPAEVKHHILQLQNGASNSKKNIIPLCRQCHGQIHPWLQEKQKGNEADGLN